ncbi:hypothetical protein [Marinobacter shengliensis]|uniref:hypothetical protein n=1 Tax=Marinobacter shengliensis TaxID=1389223 RepID=UPI0025739F92|nr:hypothetical protein [Marinobacter shengliensis]BEH15147.1 hypothetical protein MAALD49_25150 [Marinobacter shengliensis]
MSEQRLQAGERRQTEAGDILALSPLPVETGAEAADPVQWIRQKNNECMDLQGGNLVFAAEFALMFVSLMLLMLAAGFAMTFAVFIDRGTWDWEPPLYLLILNAFLTLPWGLVIHFRASKELKKSPPIRLNRKKRQVAIPHWVPSGKEVKIPLWGESLFMWVYIVYFITFGVIITPFISEGPVDAYGWTFAGYGLLALIIESLIFVPYLLIGLKLRKKHAPRLEYVYYPWEKLVAYIEERRSLGPTIFTEQVMLTLAVPNPDDPQSALAATSINVGHETAGIAQWESLRRFMEDGPEACPDPQNNDTLAHYKENCRKARQEKSMGAWLWKKVGDWFFQRYLAHKLTEWRTKRLLPKTLPKDLHEWSQPVPEGQQAKPSEELKKANQKIRALRKKNSHLTPQRLLEEFYKLSTENETLLA